MPFAHTHEFSCAWSFRPIHTSAVPPPPAVTAKRASALSVADEMMARSSPLDRQSVRAAAHVRGELTKVKIWGGSGGGGNGGERGGTGEQHGRS